MNSTSLWIVAPWLFRLLLLQQQLVIYAVLGTDMWVTSSKTTFDMVSHFFLPFTMTRSALKNLNSTHAQITWCRVYSCLRLEEMTKVIIPSLDDKGLTKMIFSRAKHFADMKEFKDIFAAKGTAPGKWKGSGCPYTGYTYGLIINHFSDVYLWQVTLGS